MPVNAHCQAKATIDKSMAKILSPRTATSFYHAKKGLYFHSKEEVRNLANALSNQTTTGVSQIGTEHHSRQKSVNLIKAYGETGAVRAVSKFDL